MLQLPDAADAVLSELDLLADRLADVGAEAWAAPTRCAEWNLADLVRHVAAVAWQQAEAFHRTRLALAHAPSWLEVTWPPERLAEAVRIARDHMAAGLQVVVADEGALVPLVVATTPALFAVNGALLEYGVHRNDVEAALGTPTRLSGGVVDAVLGLAPFILSMTGKPAACEGDSYRLAAPEGTVVMRWHDGRWHGTYDDGEPVQCEVRGDGHGVALFALGRVEPGEPGLDFTGDADLAGRFASCFPGF